MSHSYRITCGFLTRLQDGPVQSKISHRMATGPASVPVQDDVEICSPPVASTGWAPEQQDNTNTIYVNGKVRRFALSKATKQH